MPELAEVLYFSRRWAPALDQKVLRVHLHDQKRVLRGVRTARMRSTLRGQPLRAIQTHGKQMLFRFGSDCWLGVHLGMTGKLSAEPPNHLPGKHDHLVLYTQTRALVFQDPRLFGRIRFDRSLQPPGWWSSLPTPVLSREFSIPRLSGILKKRGRTPLKPLLLLQEFFPGIGNWMADEILWQARLHPRTQAGTLNQPTISRLHAKIQKISTEAIRIIGRNWSDPPRSWLFLHRWEDGGKCPRCRESLRRQPVGGRTTCWCPDCQKAALPRGRSRS